jgi:hypothetical protein
MIGDGMVSSLEFRFGPAVRDRDKHCGQILLMPQVLIDGDLWLSRSTAWPEDQATMPEK